MTSWHVSGPAGLRFNWAKQPTFECPNADPVTYTASARDGEEGTSSLTRDELVDAAAAIGADALMAGKLLRQRHASHAAGRLRVDGALTGRCAICATKMAREGFRAWVDAPADDAAAERVAARLGFSPPRQTQRTTWHATKRDAEAWARHERRRAQAAGT